MLEKTVERAISIKGVTSEGHYQGLSGDIVRQQFVDVYWKNDMDT